MRRHVADRRSDRQHKLRVRPPPPQRGTLHHTDEHADDLRDGPSSALLAVFFLGAYLLAPRYGLLGQRRRALRAAAAPAGR
jgi:hypothetical protein